MKPLDDELRNLLRRKEPPEGFAGRVVARVEAAHLRLPLAQRVFRIYRRPVLRWATVAAVACALAVLGVVQHQQRMRAQAQQASQEALLALQITRVELNAALERAQRVTVQALAVSKNPKSEME